jgi:putative effector of murein hydrolase LrgA (UPF0299 family)
LPYFLPACITIINYLHSIAFIYISIYLCMYLHTCKLPHILFPR